MWRKKFNLVRTCRPTCEASSLSTFGLTLAWVGRLVLELGNGGRSGYPSPSPTICAITAISRRGSPWVRLLFPPSRPRIRKIHHEPDFEPATLWAPRSHGATLEDTSMKHDGSGHAYINFNGVRFTYIPAEDRDSKKNWAGQDVIAVRAYKADDKGLHMGAEIPIGDGRGVVGLIAAICALVSAR